MIETDEFKNKWFGIEDEKNKQEEEIKQSRGFGDIFGDFGTSTLGLSKSVINSLQFGRARNKVTNPDDDVTDEQYEKDKQELLNLYKEKLQNNEEIQNAMQRLAGDDKWYSDFARHASTVGGTLPFLPLGYGGAMLDTAGTRVASTGIGAKVGLGMKAVGKGMQLVNAVADADTAAEEAADKVMEEGGDIFQAQDAKDNAFSKELWTTIPEIVFETYAAKKLMNGLGSFAKNSKFGQAIINSPVGKFSDPVGDFATYLAQKTGSRRVGQAVNFMGTTALNAGKELIQEHPQNVISNVEANSVLGKENGDYSLDTLKNYVNSDEFWDTNKGIAATTLLMGVPFAGVTANAGLKKGYSNANATNFGDNIQKFHNEKFGDISDKTNIVNTPEFDKRFADIKEDIAMAYEDKYGEKIDVEKDIKNVGDAGRLYEDLMSDVYGEEAAKNAFINSLYGENAGRADYTSDISREFFDKYDKEALGSLNKDRVKFEQELKQQERVEQQKQKVQEEINKKMNNQETQNSEGVKFRTNNPERGEEVSQQTGNENGSAEQTEVFNPTENINGFQREVQSEDVQGYDNYMYTKDDKKVLFSKVKGKYWVSDANSTDASSTKAKRFDTQEEAENFIKNLADGTETFTGKRFMLKDGKFVSEDGEEITDAEYKESLPKDDGVISEKDNNKQDSNNDRIAVIHHTDDLRNFYKKTRNTKDALSADKYMLYMNELNRLGFNGSGNTIELYRGKGSSGEYGSSEQIGVNDKGVMNAVVKLYMGSDVGTAMHEIAHVGYWNLSQEKREIYNRFALKSQKKYVATVLGEQFNEDFKQRLQNAIETKSGYLWERMVGRKNEKGEFVNGNPNLQYTIELLLYGDLTDQQLAQLSPQQREGLQRAYEERFAQDFSVWVAEGYTKGKRPQNIIQRILNEVCESLGRNNIKFISNFSKFLKAPGYEKYQFKGKESPIRIFQDFSITGDRQQQTAQNVEENGEYTDNPNMENVTYEEQQENQNTEEQTQQQTEQEQQETPQQNTQQEQIYQQIPQSTNNTIQQQTEQQETQQEETIKEPTTNPFTNLSDEKLLSMMERVTEGTTEGTKRELYEEAVRRGLIRFGTNNKLEANPLPINMTNFGTQNGLTANTIPITNFGTQNGLTATPLSTVTNFGTGDNITRNVATNKTISEGINKINELNKQQEKQEKQNQKEEDKYEKEIREKMGHQEKETIDSLKTIFKAVDNIWNELDKHEKTNNNEEKQKYLEYMREQIYPLQVRLKRVKNLHIINVGYNPTETGWKRGSFQNAYNPPIYYAIDRVERVLKAIVKHAPEMLGEKHELSNTYVMQNGRTRLERLYKKYYGKEPTLVNPILNVQNQEQINKQEEQKQKEEKQIKQKEQKKQEQKEYKKENKLKFKQNTVEEMKSVKLPWKFKEFSIKEVFEPTDNIEDKIKLIKYWAKTQFIPSVWGEDTTLQNEKRKIFSLYTPVNIQNEIVEDFKKIRKEVQQNIETEEDKAIKKRIEEVVFFSNANTEGITEITKGKYKDDLYNDKYRKGIYDLIRNKINLIKYYNDKVNIGQKLKTYVRKKLEYDLKSSLEIAGDLLGETKIDEKGKEVYVISDKKQRDELTKLYKKYYGENPTLNDPRLQEQKQEEQQKQETEQKNKNKKSGSFDVIIQKSKETLEKQEEELIQNHKQKEEEKQKMKELGEKQERERENPKEKAQKVAKERISAIEKIINLEKKKEISDLKAAEMFLTEIRYIYNKLDNIDTANYRTNSHFGMQQYKKINMKYLNKIKDSITKITSNYMDKINSYTKEIDDLSKLDKNKQIEKLEQITTSLDEKYETISHIRDTLSHISYYGFKYNSQSMRDFDKEYYGKVDQTINKITEVKKNISEIKEKVTGNTLDNRIKKYSDTLKNIENGIKNDEYVFDGVHIIDGENNKKGIGDVLDEMFNGTTNPQEYKENIIFSLKDLSGHYSIAKELSNKTVDLFNLIYDRVVNNGKKNNVYKHNDSIKNQFLDLQLLISSIKDISDMEDIINKREISYEDLNNLYQFNDDIHAVRSVSDHMEDRINELCNKIAKRLGVNGVDLSKMSPREQEEYVETMIEICITRDVLDGKININTQEVLNRIKNRLESRVEVINDKIKENKTLAKEYGILRDIGIKTINKHLSNVNKTISIIQTNQEEQNQEEQTNKKEEPKQEKQETKQKETVKKPRVKTNRTDEEKAIAKLNTVEDIVEYTKKTIKEEINENEIQNGAEDAVDLTQNKVYFDNEESRETSPDHALFEDILDNKKPIHASLLAKDITKKRGNLKQQSDKAFLIGVESSLRKLDRRVEPKTLTQEWVQAQEEVDSVLENIINPFLNSVNDEEYKQNEAKLNDNKTNKDFNSEKESTFFTEQENKRLKELLNKKQKDGRLTAMETRELRNLQARKNIYDSNNKLNNTSVTRNQMASTKEQETQERVQQAQQILNKAFPKVRFQILTHTTSSDFNEFTLNHLRSGEGNLSHGVGLYFSKSLSLNKRIYFDGFNRQYERREDIPYDKRQYERAYQFFVNRKDVSDELYNLLGSERMNDFGVIYNSNRHSGYEKYDIENLKNNIKREITGYNRMVNDLTKEATKDYAEKEFKRLKEDIEEDIRKYSNPQFKERFKETLDNLKTSLNNLSAEKILQEREQSLKEYTEKRDRANELLNNLKENNFYAKELSENGRNSKTKLLRVNGPEDNEMIKERVTFKEQPIKAQRAIIKILNSIEKEQGKKLTTRQELLNSDDIMDYKKLACLKLGIDGHRTGFNTKEEVDAGMYVSQELNKNGVYGIDYIGREDGPCVVIFNHKALDILKKFRKVEGEWVSDKPPSQKQELTDTQKQRVERKLQEKRENKTQGVTRFMKIPAGARIIDRLENEYKKEFFIEGRKLGLEDNTIKSVLNTFNSIRKVLNTKSFNEYNTPLTYLNTNDETGLGEKIKQFLIINHKVNEKIWERSMKNKRKYNIKGIGVYRNLNGVWMEEMSDKNAVINSDKIILDLLQDISKIPDKQYKLSDILTHEELYKKLPKLKDIPVYFVSKLDFQKNKNADKYKGINDVNFSGMYSPTRNALYINLDRNLEENWMQTLQQKAKSGNKEEVKKYINNMFGEMRSTVLHETQHAVQYMTKGVVTKANKVKALVLQNDIDAVYEYVKQNAGTQGLEYAKKTLGTDSETIKKFLDKKTGTKQDKQLMDTLDEYLDREEIYYADLDEMEAYDTEGRAKSGDESKLPLTQGKVESNGKVYDTYNNLIQGKGFVHRYQKAEYQTEEQKREKQVNKKGFNYIGGYDSVYGATVNSKRFQKMSKAQQNKLRKEAFENDEIARQYTDVYQVIFTEDALKYKAQRDKTQYFENNEQLWNKREEGNEVIYERVDPMEYQTRIIRHEGVNEIKEKERSFKQAGWYKVFQNAYRKYKVKLFKKAFDNTYYAQRTFFDLNLGEKYKEFTIEKNKGWQGEWYLKHGIDYNGNHVRGLNEVISEIPMTKQKKVVDYFIAKHLIDLYNENPDLVQTFTREEAEEIINETEQRDDFEQIENWRLEVIDFQRALLHETLVKSGIITEKKFEEWATKRPNYVPLNKIIEEDIDFGVKSYNRAIGIVNLKDPIKKLGNSKREIINPFETISTHAVEWAALSARNNAAKILIDAISNSEVVDTEGNVSSKGFGIFRRVKVNEKTQKVITSPDNEMKIIYIWRNGQKEFYQVADPEMYILVKTLNEQQAGELKGLLGTFLKAARTHTAILRTFSTGTPDFAAGNVTRDTQVAFFTSEHGFFPVIDQIFGAKEIIKGGDFLKEYQKEVGVWGEKSRGELLDNNLFQAIRERNKKSIQAHKEDLLHAKTAKEKAKAFAYILLDSAFATVGGYNAVLEIAEQSPRVAEYKNTRMGYKGLLDRISKMLEDGVFNVDINKARNNNKQVAAADALLLTLNFAQHGEWGYEINKYIAFANAQLIGIQKAGNWLDLLLTGHDSNNRINRQLQKDTIIRFAIGVACVLANTYRCQGDPAYEDAPEWEKKTYWIFPGGYRMGRGEVFGTVFGYPLQKAFDKILKDKNVDKAEVAGGFLLDMLHALGLPENTNLPELLIKVSPDIIKNTLGLYYNKDPFTKQTIVSSSLEKEIGYNQRNAYTSQLSVDISKLFALIGVDISAKKIDYTGKKSLSNGYKYLTGLYNSLVDRISKEKTIKPAGRGYYETEKGHLGEKIDDITNPFLKPIAQKFVVSKSMSESREKFEERYKELSKKASDKKSGNYFHMTKEEETEWKKYQETKKDLNKLDKKIKDLINDPKLNEKQKGIKKQQFEDKAREIIDKLKKRTSRK